MRILAACFNLNLPLLIVRLRPNPEQSGFTGMFLFAKGLILQASSPRQQLTCIANLSC